MPHVHLKLLDLEFESEYGFREDGFVEDVDAHYQKIHEKNIESILTDFPGASEEFKETVRRTAKEQSPEKAVGRTALSYETPPTYVIFYKQADSPIQTAFVIAHEQTHALHGMGRLDLLENSMEKIGSRVDLSRVYDSSACTKDEREFVANLGAYHTLHRAGVSPEYFADTDGCPAEFYKKSFEKLQKYERIERSAPTITIDMNSLNARNL